MASGELDVVPETVENRAVGEADNVVVAEILVVTVDCN
jgi:hypothetical protein